MRGAEITFRLLHTWDEYLAAEELQRVVWQMADGRDIVPAHLLITAQKNGGIVLGAFDARNQLIGFVFSFPGKDEAQPTTWKQCSHLLAVLPEFRGQAIGARLKLAQREITLAQGVTLMTWTYDPLLALNAQLNLVRLGGIVRRYLVEAYGEMSDGLNAGLPSDRFQVEWWLADPPPGIVRADRAVPRRNWDAWLEFGAREIFDLTFDAQGLPQIQRVHALLGETLLIEIPGGLNALKAAAFALALDWRMRTRDVFQRAFAAGFVATDFVFAERAGVRRAAYLLTR